MSESSTTHFLEEQNKKGDSQKTQTGNAQIIFLAVALVQDLVAS